MNNETKNPLDNMMKEAELLRLKAETRMIESEKRKTDLESAELERKINLQWFRRRAFFQAIVAGIVVIPLIWFYVKDIAIPLYQSDNIKLKRQNEVTADSLKQTITSHSLEVQKLQRDRNDQDQQYISDLSQIKNEYEILDSIRKSLSREYQKLSLRFSSSEQERKDLQKNYRSLQDQSWNQKQKLKELDEQIEQKKQNNALRSVPRQKIDYEEIGQMLLNRGMYSINYPGASSKHGRKPENGYPNKFSLQSNGKVVYDTATNLFWQQNGSMNYMIYEKGEAYVNDLNLQKFSGYTDWRLPTIEEALSLMESSKMNGELYIDPIFSNVQRFIWTADKSAPTLIWWVSYQDANWGREDSGDVLYIRAVR